MKRKSDNVNTLACVENNVISEQLFEYFRPRIEKIVDLKGKGSQVVHQKIILITKKLKMSTKVLAI